MIFVEAMTAPLRFSSPEPQKDRSAEHSDDSSVVPEQKSPADSSGKENKVRHILPNSIWFRERSLHRILRKRRRRVLRALLRQMPIKCPAAQKIPAKYWFRRRRTSRKKNSKERPLQGKNVQSSRSSFSTKNEIREKQREKDCLPIKRWNKENWRTIPQIMNPDSGGISNETV